MRSLGLCFGKGMNDRGRDMVNNLRNMEYSRMTVTDVERTMGVM